MGQEFVARNGLIALKDSVVSGSLNVTQGVTSSLYGTSSWANQALSASYYGGSVVSSSYSNTSSYSVNSLSSSYALTASYAANAGTSINTGSFVTTSSFNNFTSSYSTGSFSGSFSGSFYGNLTGTSSWASNSITSSYARTSETSSYSLFSLSSSYSLTSSYPLQGVITASSANTTITFTRGDGTNFSVTVAQSGSVSTASYALFAETASYYGGPVVSASYALTASYATNITVSGSINDVDYINFQTGSDQPQAEGRLGWDDGYGTLNLGLKGGNVDLAIGQEMVARVYNADSVTLVDGMVVYISGSQGNRIAVKRASATAELGSANSLGMVTEPIAAGSEGFITTQGVVNNLNTTGLTAGAIIYLSSSAGEYTTVRPTAPNHTVVLGYVERVHATVGSIYVKVDNGYELGELHDVVDSTTTASIGDLLMKNGNVWVNSKQLSGSYGLTGSLRATSFTGSLEGTASWSSNSISASSALTASYYGGSVLSASYAATTSYARTFYVSGTQQIGDTTFSYAAPLQISSSVSGPGGFNTGIVIKGIAPMIVFEDTNANDIAIASENGDFFLYGGATATTQIARWSTTTLNTDTNIIFTTDNAKDIGASGATRPRIIYVGTSVVSPAFSGSLHGTASWASNAITASHYNGSVVSSSYAFNATSASYSLTSTSASYAINSTSASYSINALSSSWSTNSLTASYYTGSVVSSSWSLSSSYSHTAQTLLGTVQSASYAYTSSYVTTLNQDVIVSGSVNIGNGGKLFVEAIGGDEGGEILLGKAVTNTTLTGSGVTIDVYQNKLRIFEQGGNSRGGYYDITALGAGVSTNLLSGGSGTTFNGGTNVDNRIVTATGTTPELNGEANLTFDGSTLTVTGNVSAVSFTGSLSGSATFATSASYALNATSASYSLNATSASYSLSSSYAPYTGLVTKAGSIANSSFGGSPKTGSVTFATAFSNTNYAITVTGEDARSWTIQSKATTGFIINSNSNIALTGTTYWIASSYGETN